MKELIIGITVVLAFHVGNIEAAQWMPLGEAEDRQLIRTNNSPEEGRIICTSKTRGNGQGIGKGGRRLGFLTKKGCKTVGGGGKVQWFTREDGDIMVLVDDEPAVQDVQGMIDSALEGMVPEEDVQGMIDSALEGMVAEEDVQGRIDAASVGMILEEGALERMVPDGLKRVDLECFEKNVKYIEYYVMRVMPGGTGIGSKDGGAINMAKNQIRHYIDSGLVGECGWENVTPEEERCGTYDCGW